MVSAALQCWLADQWMMVAVLSGTRNSANYHSQSTGPGRPLAALVVSLRDHIGGAADRAWPMRCVLYSADIRRHSGVFEVHGNAISQ